MTSAARSPAAPPANPSTAAPAIAARITSMTKTATFASQKVLRGIRPSKFPKNRIHFMEAAWSHCGWQHRANGVPAASAQDRRPSTRNERIRPVLIGADGPSPEAELDQESEPEDRERHRNGERQHAGRFVGASKPEHGKQVEHGAGAEENEQQPDRQVAIVGAF